MKRGPKPSIRLGAGVLALALCLLTGCADVEPKVVADFPAREAPNYQSLVSVNWLKGLLDYQPVDAVPLPVVTVIFFVDNNACCSAGRQKPWTYEHDETNMDSGSHGSNRRVGGAPE